MMIELGDLATIVCSYDKTAGYSSNSLSSYFHDLGWRGRLHDLVTSDWLGLDGMTLGGNYGEVSPSDLSDTLTSSAATADVKAKSSDSSSSTTCAADKDPWPVIYSNSLSAVAAAEMTRRIALYREITPTLRFPGMLWEDAQVELMGAEDSLLFPSSTLSMGGMMVDTAVFVQAALNMTQVDEVSNGQWRIHSKLGAGYSSSRSRGEIVNNAYVCLPIAINGADTTSYDGVEFTLSVRGSIPYDSSLLKVQEQVRGAVAEVVQAIMKGQI
jgi:hypothetical protein